MADTDIELYTPTLGLLPYVVIEACADPDAPAGFVLKLKGGGGIGSADEAVAMLLIAVQSITGVPTDLYAMTVDEARRAAGL